MKGGACPPKQLANGPLAIVMNLRLLTTVSIASQLAGLELAMKRTKPCTDDTVAN